MLTPPAIAHDRIIACVHENFGLCVSDVAFLPIGADVNSAAYRVAALDGTSYFLKLRRGNFNETAVAVPAYLHAHGIGTVMAPIATTTQQLWIHAHGFHWILYPFFGGKNGWEVALSQAQWAALGECIKAMHTTVLPAALAARVRTEDYSSRWREIVRAYDQQVQQQVYDDPIAARFAAFWISKGDEIHTLVERAEQLAHALHDQPVDFVVCHADLHGGNVLGGANDTLTIVDWDEVMLAPKERDLMFIGGGLFGDWNPSTEAPWFYAGYGHTSVDAIALAYYRYERIVADLAAYADQILGKRGSVEDREQGLRQITSQFLPNEVVEIAHRTYEEIG